MKQLMIVRSKVALAGLAFVFASAVSGRAAVIHVPGDYSTIQAAVDAAQNRDIIRIGAGVYVEQVVIVDKMLTLSGAPGAVLRAAPAMEQSLLTFGGTSVPLLGIVRSEVVVSGLTMDGDRQDDTGLGPYTGIDFLGSSGRVEDCRLTGFRGSVLGGAVQGQRGGAMGVHVLNRVSMGTGAVNVRVIRSTFADNERSIVLVGDATGPNQATFDPTLLRTTFSVNDNVIVGNGPDTNAAQYGIWIWAGAGGEVKRNTITDHAYAGIGLPNNSNAPFGFGIAAEDNEDWGVAPLAALQPVRYEGNVFRNNQIHLVLDRGDGSSIVNNSFEGTVPGYRPGGVGFSGENVMAVANRFDNLPFGILLFGNDPDFGTYLGIASNAKLVANKFCGVADPIVIEPMVMGTQEHGNKLDACHGPTKVTAMPGAKPRGPSPVSKSW